MRTTQPRRADSRGREVIRRGGRSRPHWIVLLLISLCSGPALAADKPPTDLVRFDQRLTKWLIDKRGVSLDRAADLARRMNDSAAWPG